MHPGWPRNAALVAMAASPNPGLRRGPTRQWHVGARVRRGLDDRHVADSIESVVYAEAQRGLALQAVLLNELRSRTGILLAVTTATSSFLGAAAIDHGGLHTWGALAIAAFAVAVACCLAVLWPHRQWTFFEGATQALGNYRDRVHPEGEAWTVELVQRDLALHMEQHADEARDAMKGMQKCFMGAGIGLAFDVAFWLIEYGT